MRRNNVISIESHQHFADYAEPGPVPIQIPVKRSSTYDHCIGVGLAVLACCAVVALVYVAAEWNY